MILGGYYINTKMKPSNFRIRRPYHESAVRNLPTSSENLESVTDNKDDPVTLAVKNCQENMGHLMSMF